MISIAKFLIFTPFMLLFTIQASAKELYLTVFRDFSSDESPIIDVNYLYRSPIIFRVLKPKDMNAFISQQIDLKRAWKKPRSEINSMRLLKIGLNSLSWRTDWLRRSVNPDLRLKLKEQYGGGKYTTGTTQLEEGHKRIIAVPDDFEIDSEFVVYPENHDKETAFDVPGLNSWFNSYQSGFHTKSINLPKLKPGFYLLQVTQGPLEGQIILVVNDIIAEVEQSGTEAILRAATRNGSPLKDGIVEVRNIQGEWKLQKKIENDGTIFLKDLPIGPLLFVVSDESKRKGTAVIDAEFLPTTADFPDLYLFADRPVYRPGDEIHVKGILRRSWDGLSRLMRIFQTSDQEVLTNLSNSDGLAQGLSVTSLVNNFGSFSASLLAPMNETGLFKIVSRFLGDDYIGEIRVQEYIKPLYFLTTKTDQKSLKAGGNAKVAVNIERYAGGIPPQVQLRADLYRERLTLPDWIETEGLSESGNPQIYGIDSSRFKSPSIPYHVLSIENISFDKNGQAFLSINVPEQVPGEQNFDYSYRLNLFAYDNSGENAQTSISFLDTRSSITPKITLPKVYLLTGVKETLKVTSFMHSGDKAPKKRGTAFWTFTDSTGNKSTLPQTDFVTDQNGEIKLEIPTNRAGAFEVNVDVFDDQNQKSSSSANFFVYDPTSKKSDFSVPSLSLFSNKVSLTQQESAEVLVLLPEKWGVGFSDQGIIHVTIAGKKIYSHKKISLTGYSALLKINVEPRFDKNFYLIVSYPDPARGWIERQMAFSVIPTEKILKLSMEFSNKELTPLGEQTVFFKVRDYRDRPVAAEIALSVVDEAVYRIQDEFRPPLIDFFYPKERLNLMSFVSHHFQSYGYGESLASKFKSNFFFAAPKPEKSKFDRDTAYWNPTIITREDGTAEVSFKLPSNQTKWRATAIAIDRHGSFGETRGSFKANRKIALVSHWPRSLKTGDEVNVNMKVIATENADETGFKIDILSEELTTMTAKSIFEGIIKPRLEASFPVRFKLSTPIEEKPVLVKALLSTATQKTEYQHAIKALGTAATFQNTSRFNKENMAKIQVLEGEKIEAIKINFAAGLTGTLNFAASSLIQYPYGCVEQLTSSVVTNFINFKMLSGQYLKDALYEKPAWTWWESIKSFFTRSLMTVKGLNANKVPSPGDKVRQRLISDSEQFYKASLQRLKQYQNEDGSLAWWSGLGRADFSMTLISLYVLTALKDLNLTTSIDISEAWRWLEKQPVVPDSSENILRLTVYGQLVARGLLQKPSESHESRSQLRFLMEKTMNQRNSQIKMRDLAWIIHTVYLLDLHHDRDFITPLNAAFSSLKALFNDSVSAALQSVSIQNEHIIPDNSGQWHNYPGTLISSLALTGRVLHEYDLLKKPERDRLVEVIKGAFDGARFLSTFETAHILLHSEGILKDESRSVANQFIEPKIFFQGKPILTSSIDWEPTIGGFSAKFRSESITPGIHTVQFETDQNNVFGSVVVTKKAEYKDIKADFSQWQLDRRIFRIDPEKHTLTLLSPQQVLLGDLLYIEVRVTEKAGNLSTPYLMVEDAIPSGLIPVMDDRAYTAAPWNLPLRPKIPFKREFLMDRVRFHLQNPRGLQDSFITVGYLARAGFQGYFQGGLTKVEDMYQDAIASYMPSPPITIERM